MNATEARELLPYYVDRIRLAAKGELNIEGFLELKREVEEYEKLLLLTVFEEDPPS